MPTEPTAKRRVELGPTGETVRSNIQRIRKGQRLTHADLVERMGQHGYRMPRTALSEIESGGRRVSSDDLVALAVALNVNPNALLLPPVYGDERFQASGLAAEAKGHFLWSWAEGLFPLIAWGGQESAEAAFRQYARPAGYPHPIDSDETDVEALLAVAHDMKATVEALRIQADRLGISTNASFPEDAGTQGVGRS